MNRRMSLKLLIGLSFLTACSSPNGPTNKPPVIDEIIVNGYGLKAVAHDPEGEPLFYTWTANGGSFITTTGFQTRWYPPGNGTYTIVLMVSDGVNSVTKSIKLNGR